MAVHTHEWSADPKREATAAIARAQADLERAVDEIARLPAMDVHSVALAAHALTSFLTVTGAVVDMLIPVLRDHPDRQVGIWLEGLSHATSLMSHTVSQMMNTSVGVATTLRLDDVDVLRLVERACSYYERAAQHDAVAIRFAPSLGITPIRTDRVLVAAVLDSLLSNAVKRSRPHTTITVDVRPDRGCVTCTVRDEGPALSREDGEHASSNSSGGYGLAVAGRFVSLLGGEISCDSAIGHGMTISLWLPGIVTP